MLYITKMNVFEDIYFCVAVLKYWISVNFDIILFLVSVFLKKTIDRKTFFIYNIGK